MLNIIIVNKYLVILVILNACAVSNIDDRQLNIVDLNKDKYSENTYKQDLFNIFSLKKTKNNDVLIVYIEGDGLAWSNRFTPSSDPTPINPLAFRLALKDKSENIIYLARPCQYILSANCNKDIWTNLQYSDSVLGVYEAIFESLSDNYREVHVVGYSGGAAIAIYIASLENLNIKSIRTVAGNINPDEISELLNLSGYEKSINFYSLEKKIKNISQIHYYATKDKVVPKKLHLDYAERNFQNLCTKIQPVSATHSDGWIDFWNENYKLNINC